MNERPLLIFPSPESVPRPKGSGGGDKPPPPVDFLGRGQRIREQIERAINYIQEHPGDPGTVLVIETVGKISDFHKAVEKIPGLEWLGETDEEEIMLEPYMYEAGSEDERIARKEGGRRYLSSSNQQAAERLLGLWNKWEKDNKKLSPGYGIWANIFKYMNKLRRWNERDRLQNTGILEEWKEDLEIKRGSNSEINFEAELHYRQDSDAVRQDIEKFERWVSTLSGQINKKYRNNDIGSHALKTTLPTSDKALDEIQKIIKIYESGLAGDDYPEWVCLPSIKYFRPTGQQWIDIGEPRTGELQPTDWQPVPPSDHLPPVIALLDGVPIRQHQLLKDFLIFDDPDEFYGRYERPTQQKHGTQMASLVCHQDLGNPSKKSLGRKIYMRPIMHYHSDTGREQVPVKDFPEDLIERAVVRLFEKQNGEETNYPSVRIINLSVGGIKRPFHREISSWAKLLDYLSWKYKVLFIISAGNYQGELQVQEQEQEFSLDKIDINQFILSMHQKPLDRKILAPADSINNLTVGAIHDDYSNTGMKYEGLFDPLTGIKEKLPAEYSCWGPGYRRQIKPDILAPGGKILYRKEKQKLIQEPDRENVGQRAASVGYSSEDMNYTRCHSGTSNAAAVTTHSAGRLFEVLEELRNTSKEIPEQYDALLLKALLVHSADWGTMYEYYECLKNRQNSRIFNWILSQYLGYGAVDFERVMACTQNRVTLLGYGELSEHKEIEQRERHRFLLSLPELEKLSLRFIITLAWFSPINPFRYGWRQAKLSFGLEGLSKKERKDAQWQQVRKGTVQHEIFDVDQFESNSVEILVDCASDAAEYLDEPIPYALSCTVEAREKIDIDLYEVIRESVRVRA